MAKKIIKSKLSIKRRNLSKEKRVSKRPSLAKSKQKKIIKKKSTLKVSPRKKATPKVPSKKRFSVPSLKKIQPLNRFLKHPLSIAKVVPEPSQAEYIPVQKPQLRKYVNVDDSSLPDLSDKTRLRLMARDPNWIHAYWQVAPAKIQEAQRDLGKSFDNARYVLRMHDVTCVDFNGRNANRTFDIEVSPTAQSWCVDSWQDNVSYCAQIGLSTHSGEFYSLAESNFVHTPRSNFSDRRD
ncbi:MAG: DUF4912 domain-containing protein, partial [Candidatus Omnitrophota bacterium]